MNAWELPTTLEIGGVGYPIRTDFRAIIDILISFNDPELEEDEKWMVALIILYIDFDDIPREYYQEAMEKCMWFINCGQEFDSRHEPRTMDWEQDAPILIPAVNKVLGYEVRSVKELHWWTFMGAYMEIGEGLFSEVINIRIKKRKNKKLEKDEQEFYAHNKELVDLRPKLTEKQQEKKDKLLEMIKNPTVK